MTAQADTVGILPPAAEPARRNQGDRVMSIGLLAPSLLLVLAGLLFPLLLMARYSVNRFQPGEMMVEALTLDNYARFFSDPFYLTMLGRTLGMALGATMVCLLLGLPAAYCLSRLHSRRLKALLVLLTVIPLLMGNAVRATGWIVLLAERGLLNAILSYLGLIDRPLRILYTGSAVAIGLVAVLLPLMVITLQSTFEAVSPAYEEAASSLGAKPASTFARVVLPMIMPGVFSGCLLCFVLAINAYATPVLIGGPSFHMMAPKVYEQAIKVYNWPFAASMAFILMAVTLTLTVSATLALRRRYGAM